MRRSWATASPAFVPARTWNRTMRVRDSAPSPPWEKVRAMPLRVAPVRRKSVTTSPVAPSVVRR